MSLTDLANTLVTAISERATARAAWTTAKTAVNVAAGTLVVKDAAVASALAALEAEAEAEANAGTTPPPSAVNIPYTYGNGGTTAGEITVHQANSNSIYPNKTDANGATINGALLAVGAPVRIAMANGNNPLNGTIASVSDSGGYYSIVLDDFAPSTPGEEAGFAAGDAVVLTVG